MPTIKIQQPNKFIGRLRKFNVYVNDKKIGAVANSDTQEFEIAAGQHRIYCKQDIFNSPFVYDFSIEKNETRTFIVQYLNEPISSILMLSGIFLSAFLSQLLTAYLKINQGYWIAFYTVFVVLLLLVMKATKQFAINISE